MAQKLRLVAKRGGVSYSLDLLQSPNISINFKFSDIKDPASRKSSYSQSFKLPFTDNNNKYFQDWNNPNTTPLADGFTTNQENSATLYVNELEQFVGVLVLKGSYQDSGYYEVLLLSDVANLFTMMGQKTVKQAFNDYETLNHTLNETNISASWNNTMGADFQDSVGDCSKILYPIQSYSSPLLWTQGDFLNNNGSPINYDVYDEEEGETISVFGLSPNKINLNEQKPAIQLRSVLERIFTTNGFTWTSVFFDSVYFRRLYMTTCNFMSEANSQPPVTAPNDNPFVMYGRWGYTNMRAIQYKGLGGYASPGVANNLLKLKTPPTQTYQNVNWSSSLGANLDYNVSQGNLTQNEDGSANFTDAGFINIPFQHNPGELQIKINTNISVIVEVDSDELETPFSPPSGFVPEIFMGSWEPWVGAVSFLINTDGNVVAESEPKPFLGANPVQGDNIDSVQDHQLIRNNINYNDGSPYPNGDFFGYADWTFYNTVEIPANTEVRLQICAIGVTPGSPPTVVTSPFSYSPSDINIEYNEPALLLGKPSTYVGEVADTNCTTIVEISGNSLEGYNAYGGTIDIPNCIDPSISQKAFIKDLSDRFNLIIQTDPTSPTNLLIEPMADFLSSGVTTKLWTDKLDTSKEIYIEPTTSLQFKEIHFADLPDVDFMNKFVHDFYLSTEPHGRYDKIYNANTYNTGNKLKNEPIFSPYIIEETPYNETTGSVDVFAFRTLLHRTYSYDDEGLITFPATKPKLFYYGGRPMKLDSTNVIAYNIYLHFVDEDGINQEGYNEYPLCSAFNIDRDLTNYSGGTTGLQADSISLRWGESFVFGSNNAPFGFSGAVTNTLYKYYWSEYLSQLYHPDTRLMTAYFKLDEVDISNFNFNDSIFIKDSYWRILDISNYQAGTGESVKVKLIKIVEKVSELNDYSQCPFYPSGNTYGWFGEVPSWIDASDNTTEQFAVPYECCFNNGLDYFGPIPSGPSEGLYICIGFLE